MFLSAYRDISDRKRTEEALRAARVAADAANKAKSDFLARMSHELRTPLNGILGYAQILKREQQLNEAQRRGIEVIQNSGEHLLELINDILDLSKIEAQRFELHPSQFDLSTILRTVVDLIKVKADEKKLRFVYETLSELPRIVFGDARVMKQVLLNLLGNAIKFTDRGQVTLQALYHEHRITFRVRDTGVGIPAEKLKEIFEPFKQVGDGMRKVEGTGLGLSISKRLVEMMKGTLSVESTIGSGSIFAIEIELPEVEGEEILAERTRTDIVGYKGTRKRILVADDNPGNIGILTAILTPLGFETIVAKNGQEAVDAAGERKPDLVLIDMVMPVMDGFDATRHIRRIPTKNALPIIAISASVLRKDRARYLEAGCDDFIAKPFKLEELLAKLRRYLGIEWIYQSSAVEQQKTVSEVSSAGQKEIPPLESLRRLYKLVIQGNFGELSAELNTLAARNSAYGEFIETIRQFADRYDEDGIIKYIEQLEPWRNGAH
jgi:CheY-like chemotaxis protein